MPTNDPNIAELLLALQESSTSTPSPPAEGDLQTLLSLLGPPPTKEAETAAPLARFAATQLFKGEGPLTSFFGPMLVAPQLEKMVAAEQEIKARDSYFQNLVRLSQAIRNLQAGKKATTGIQIVQSGPYYRVLDKATGEPIPDGRGLIDRKLPHIPTASDFLTVKEQRGDTIIERRIPVEEALEAARTGKTPKGLETIQIRPPKDLPSGAVTALSGAKTVISTLEKLKKAHEEAFPEEGDTLTTLLQPLVAAAALNKKYRLLADYTPLDILDLSPAAKKVADLYNMTLGDLRSLTAENHLSENDAKRIMDSLGHFQNPRQFRQSLNLVIQKQASKYNQLVRGLRGGRPIPGFPLYKLEEKEGGFIGTEDLAPSAAEDPTNIELWSAFPTAEEGDHYRAKNGRMYVLQGGVWTPLPRAGE